VSNRKQRLVLAIVLTLLSISSAAQIAHAGDPPIVIGYEEKGLELGATNWTLDKVTGEIVPVALGQVTQDPNQYKADLQCQVDDDSLEIDCLPGQRVCPPRDEDGKAGIPVVWKVAPRAIVNPEWIDWEATGGPTCLYDQRPEDILPRIAARIAAEFKNLPIHPADLTTQPSPHTLRGAETNVFGNASEQQFDVTILGQQVHVIATPSEYSFDYGDGTSLGPTTLMGSPLPEDRWGEKTRTSHVYTETGDFRVVLTTYFQGTYSVNNGPALPIPEQGQFNSPTQTISVWRSITRNYADDCIANPQGQGCPGVPSIP
jgi:hypothetical protein